MSNPASVPRPSLSSVQGFTEVWIDPFDLHPNMIKIEDIAHSLAEIPRFGGFLRRCGTAKTRTWSVGQHSLVVSALCHDHHKIAGLFHDATEILLSDLAAPIKYHPRLQGYRELETELQYVFAAALGYRFPYDPPVKRADMIVRWAEADLFHYGTAHWGDVKRVEADEPDVTYAKTLIEGIVDLDAEQLFLSTYRILMGVDVHAHV